MLNGTAQKYTTNNKRKRKNNTSKNKKINNKQINKPQNVSYMYAKNALYFYINLLQNR